jgi:hypothetical protein
MRGRWQLQSSEDAEATVSTTTDLLLDLQHGQLSKQMDSTELVKELIAWFLAMHRSETCCVTLLSTLSLAWKLDLTTV